VDHDLGTADRFAYSGSGREISTHPFDTRIVARLAREHAHLLPLASESRDDRATEMSCSSSHENLHLLSS